MFGFLFLAPYARTTRYEEASFSLENEGKKGSLRSRASWWRGFFAWRQKTASVASLPRPCLIMTILRINTNTKTRTSIEGESVGVMTMFYNIYFEV